MLISQDQRGVDAKFDVLVLVLTLVFGLVLVFVKLIVMGSKFTADFPISVYMYICHSVCGFYRLSW